MSDQGIKVTDRRMFDARGELREEYRFLEDAPRAASPAPGDADADRPVAAAEPPEPGDDPRGRVELPPAEPTPGSPGFLELLQVLAEPIPVYLGEARLPSGEEMENLDAARFYIDLLELLRRKTAGNLTAQEADVLEDLLYRFRLRYVQKQD